MPRRVEIAVQAEKTEALVRRISGMDGLIGLRVQQGISRRPEGDVITLDITNRSLPALTRLLSEEGVGSSSAGSFSTSEPVSIVSSSSVADIVHDVSEATWEEMEVVIAKNSNMTVNALVVMVISGVLATIGIATNALHIVIGAMQSRTRSGATSRLPREPRVRHCSSRRWANHRSGARRRTSPPGC
jgi:hypothetical protein